MVLVDTNIWIDAFKNSASPIIPALAELIIEKQACITPIIRAELLSGARRTAEYRLLEDRLVSAVILEEKSGLWYQAAYARFRLARTGIQESLIDLSIACIAHQHRTRLWTNDKRFHAIEKVIPFKRFEP
jgi:tRNA(fMet)-specific endonuclease VapC